MNTANAGRDEMKMQTITEPMPKILLLEDNLKKMEELADALEPAGYELHYSIAGRNLTEMMYRKKFDLVLYSMMVDGLNDFDALKTIRESRLNSEIPIVFITDTEKKSKLMKGLHISGIDFLKTPFDREELLTRINNQILMLKTNKRLDQSRSVTKSIRYAERIQKSLIPSEEMLKACLPEHFLINLPLDIVSGDFYWVKQFDHLRLIAVADCTGHGVPGAFLSILGISLLNEICSQSAPDCASGVLEKLRSKMKSALRRADGHSQISDGMDIALILIDTQKLTMQFSGGYSRIFISRKGEISELKGDSQPIGFHPVEKAFTDHNMELQRDDTIYLTTDGYVDQFGGDRGKKLQYRNLKSLLQTISPSDMSAQKAVLLKEHMDWKGINEQVDDILMLGIRME